MVDVGTTTAAPDELSAHPINQDIYTDRDNGGLAERIAEHGFRESQRIIATPDLTILSGHRRWNAAKQAGVESVPIEVVDVDPESDEALVELLSANDYREKTPGEKIREGELWEELERERAKEREQSGGVETLPQGETGKTRDKVGEKVGLSGRSYERGKEVKDAAEAGDETAQEEWERMESGEQSIHGAFESVTADDDAPDTVAYQFDPERELWEAWGDTVPRSVTLDQRLSTLISQDLRTANRASGDGYDEMEERTARLLASRIGRRAQTATQAIERDDMGSVREHLGKIQDLAETFQE